ncbi:hypothetical protein SSM2_059 [Synechococcus phage S-SM2]|jgi:hypothetical protein|uniref:Uncharacterized protein n=1 Tax=Synechococcus phage S-SM2 TaxID=444860 RepID=E3SIV3_9CAUD|nr:hypothetical protein SSM2_059 [Synechococcus phage S-SM2]ADO97401.1 hypothetical protein SSM2_059 [Synechococcus phage S-SM2]
MLNYGGNLPRPMTQKFLYVVDHFIPFPRSEYGGIWNVVAENDDECFDLITAEDDGLNDDYYNRLRENIMKAPTYALAENPESEIVEQFTT